VKKNIITDNTWTLFLDRDGVINQQKEGGYILNWDEFVFYDGVKEAMQVFSTKFKHICIITNQRGVGKGDMSLKDLQNIHQILQVQVTKAGGRIDQFYFCTDVDATSDCRKPNAGMAFQAKNDFPAINFSKTIMVGNSLSDMEFGRKIGATNIFLNTTNFTVNESDERVDCCFATLYDFAKTL
jgi:histidinol-phosphate phosphatase family protein